MRKVEDYAMPTPAYPACRPRRLRQAPWTRAMVRETVLTVDDLIWPIFVIDGENRVEDVPSMPGVQRLSVDRVLGAAEQAVSLGIPMVEFFPYTDPSVKTPTCEEAWNPDNLVCRATRAVKAEFPQLGVMLDVALDPYNSDGHDGLVREGCVLNDETLEALARQTLNQARAGADVMGPSDMMDGRVAAMRASLEGAGFCDVMIMSYAAKYASCFFNPFRDAVGSGGALKGDKKTYQMDPANTEEALRETAMDIAEGADMVMVKPGLPYLDICRRLRDAFDVPVFAYNVSGEYAMIKAAAQAGWLDGERAMMESLQSFKRAGCDGILTYFAPEAAKLLRAGWSG
jgi:porphobilinogen synthase